MIYITENSPAEAWEKAFIHLYNLGREIEINGFYKNECAAIEISKPLSLSYSNYFPIDKDVIEVINRYIVTGEDEEKIDHQWTKLYRKRLFCEENQIEKIISILKEWPDCPRAQISTWKNGKDLKRNEIAPCLQLLWFKLIDDKLDIHVHMRTTDCYSKLLLNFNEFIAIQKYVSKKISKELGVYRHFIDSLHFHKKDKDKVDQLQLIINK